MAKKDKKVIELTLTEDQAEWIRIGLQCYRNACQVPASFGSAEFLEKVNQISAAIDWFDATMLTGKKN